MSWVFSPSFMKIGQKMWIFTNGWFFDVPHFFDPAFSIKHLFLSCQIHLEFICIKCEKKILSKYYFIDRSHSQIKTAPTPWIFAQKWGMQNMSLEKIYFALWMYTKAGEKEFLKSYIGLSSCHLTSTGRPVHSAGINGAV